MSLDDFDHRVAHHSSESSTDIDLFHRLPQPSTIRGERAEHIHRMVKTHHHGPVGRS
jgi:hypothetical protein